MATRVFVADAQYVVRLGVRRVVASADIEIVGEGATFAEVHDGVNTCEPDLVLLEPRLVDVDGLQAMSQVKLQNPELPVLVFSADNSPAIAARSLALGSHGFLSKECSGEELINSILSIAAGNSLWTTDNMRRLTGALGARNSPVVENVLLTPRELEVLRHMTFGQTNKEIGTELNISSETVKEHIQHMLRKIGVWDRTQAAVWSVRNELF